MSSNIGTTYSHCLYSHRLILIENHFWNNPTWSKTLQLEMYTEIEQPLATGVLYYYCGENLQCHIRHTEPFKRLH